MPEFAYELIRSSRKTISITVTHDARVVVRAPVRVSKKEIEAFVGQKQRWILEKLELMRQRAERHRPIEAASFEELPFLGRRLQLAVSEKAAAIEAVGDTLAFPKAWLPEAPDRLRQWYCKQAAAVLTERLTVWREHTGIRNTSAHLSDARKRWGSCSGRGSLNFTWRLVMAPLDVIDYIVVHELTHIEHMDHSKAFWARVGEIMPDYKEKKKWLKENAGLLNLF